ncbi:hypothetical protein RFI_34397 [Reticulomyxa filosa]|uniref:VLIG-type G domain-containing protein n=1 Tax=Reticulomyxa filosa TaxID=46433 RepID=X6LQJ3_RETFI|nr:hypothetical protein RFI_34397 [Reticulomyxa filosa]|eukprot:ETO03015.1 hypothetical protein RFI_34397 [Reticulomyxa filosa]
MKAVARELSKERVNRFFHNNSSTLTWKEDFEIGYKALTKWIPDTAFYHSFWHSYHKDLDKEVCDLYKQYERCINKGDNISQKRKEEEQREEEKENQKLNEKKSFQQQSDGNKPTSKGSQALFGSFFSKKTLQWSKSEMQLTEDGNKIAENYTFIQIQSIALFGQIYEYFKFQFPVFKAIKTVSDQEKELKEKYNDNRLKQESELDRTFLKKLEDKLKNGCPLVCGIEKWQDNKINLNMSTRLKPIRRLTFTFGNFTNPNPDYLELKQVVQKNNEFDIHSNEELVFVYGLSNNEIVLVLSIDKNVSDCLPEDEEINKEDEKYDVGNEHAKKQDVWNEQYNQNYVTKIFLSSRQTLNRAKRPIGELRGRMTLVTLSEQRHYMMLYERARQLIHVYSWKERIVDSLQPLNKTIDLRERVLPDGSYVTSMCFDNKNDNLYILDSTNIIRCIDLDRDQLNHEREIVCKEQYVKLMTTFEGGYIVGIKPHEKKKEEVQTNHNKDKVNKEDVQTPDEHDEPGSATTDIKGETQAVTLESSTSMNTSNAAIITSTKFKPNSLVQCDFYILDDSKELVRSLVLPKEFTSGGIHGIQFKLILQTQAYVVSLDDARCALLCLPLQISLKKSQLHLELTSMYGDVTIPSDDEKVGTRIPSKLDYIEYSLDKFGSKPEFFIQKKLTLHLSVLFDANEITHHHHHGFRKKIKQDTKKVFRHLDWQCVPLVIDGKNKQIHLKDVLKLVKNHSPFRSGDEFIRQVIVQFPMQIARASGGEFVLLHNGENDQARYAHCTTNGSFVDCIRFGGYDALINSWPGKIRVVSSMGKQSTGKSYMLNHLLGCKFDISGARCTDGVWITARIVGDILYVILDFEGLGSFERSPQEDALLSVFNASISNCTVFKCENRFDQDIAKMFERFQNGVQFLRDDNDKLFKGRLLIVIKDIPPADTKQVISEFSKKIASFCQDCTDKNGESESFVMQMYKDPTNIYIEPYPPLTHISFFKKLIVLRRSIESLPIIHGDGGILFLRHMKAIMAKLTMKDWNSNLSEQIVESAVERVQQYTESVINFGTLTISKTFESLERFDVNEDMEVVDLTKKEKIVVKNSDVVNSLLQKLEHVQHQSNEQSNETMTEQISQLKQWKGHFEKILDNIPNAGLNLIHNNILKFLYREFERQVPECKRGHSTHKKWFITFQLFLKLIYLRRELTLEKWITNELHGFGFQTLRGNNNVQEQTVGVTDKRVKRGQKEAMAKFIKPLTNIVLNQLQAAENLLMLCGAKCKDCYFLCLLRHAHQWNGEADHSCLGSHQCVQLCKCCQVNANSCDKEEILPCKLQAGHESFHDCRRKSHKCDKDCSLRQYGNCNEKCGLEFGHSSETACMCNSPIHYCNENCSLPGCPNKCEIDYAKEHTRHECSEKRCTKRCEIPSCGIFFFKKSLHACTLSCFVMH